MPGGAAEAGEPYGGGGGAGARELSEERGVQQHPWLVLTFPFAGVVSSCRLAVPGVVVRRPVRPDPAEIARHARPAQDEPGGLRPHGTCVADAREAFSRYRARSRPPGER